MSSARNNHAIGAAEQLFWLAFGSLHFGTHRHRYYHNTRLKNADGCAENISGWAATA